MTNAGGGYGEDDSKNNGTAGSGQSGYGGGGNVAQTGFDGVVILRYSGEASVSFDSLQLTGSSYTDGTDKYTIFTGGTGTISFV